MLCAVAVDRGEPSLGACGLAHCPVPLSAGQAFPEGGRAGPALRTAERGEGAARGCRAPLARSLIEEPGPWEFCAPFPLSLVSAMGPEGVAAPGS